VYGYDILGGKGILRTLPLRLSSGKEKALKQSVEDIVEDIKSVLVSLED